MIKFYGLLKAAITIFANNEFDPKNDSFFLNRTSLPCFFVQFCVANSPFSSKMKQILERFLTVLSHIL